MKNFLSIITDLLKSLSLKKIHYKITVLIWAIIIFSILVFLAGTIPFQRSAALERMNTEAKDITNSISLVSATAIISEDYSFAVDHCMNVLKQSQNLVYIVITKNDGFSLIHHKDGWTIDTLKGFWRQTNQKQASSDIFKNEFSENLEIYSYSTPFSYSGINWGWIHIGLSLEKFNSDNNSTTNRSIFLAFICILIGLVAAFYFTKKLIFPIKILDVATKKVAQGDFSARANLKTGDELQSLGDSFNIMTEALFKSRNENLAAHEFTNNIIRSLNDTLIVCDTSWRITKVNLATLHLLGYSEQEMLGKTIDIVFDDWSSDKFQNNFMMNNIDSIEDKFYDDELYYVSKSSQRIPVLFSSSVLLSNENETIGYVIIALDITERKEAETALRQAHDELEQRVLSRTQELEKLNSKLLSEIETRINAEEKIKASLQEKEVLLKEIHHRVKNNLQVISSLLYLQSNKIAEKKYKEIFNESQNRIKSMALVHEKLYKSVDLAGIELSDYIRSLVNYLMRSYDVGYHKIKQEINVDNIFLSIDKSIPFGLIINELVTNILKYAFVGRDEGLFRININKGVDGTIIISVYDDGVGMPNDFDIKNSNSLGLRLVQTLVTQLEGTFKLKSDEGSEFIIEFSEHPTEKTKDADELIK